MKESLQCTEIQEQENKVESIFKTPPGRPNSKYRSFILNWLYTFKSHSQELLTLLTCTTQSKNVNEVCWCSRPCLKSDVIAA